MADTGKTIALIKALAPAPEIDPEQVKQDVEDWLDDHPEATTTVQDGSITRAKLASGLEGDLAAVEGMVDGVIEYVAGANLCDESEKEQGFIQSAGGISVEGSFINYFSSAFIPVKRNTKYVLTSWNKTYKTLETSRMCVNQYDAGKDFIIYNYQNISGEESILINTTATTDYIRVSWYKENDPVLTEGQTAPEAYIPYFAPYKIMNANLGETPIDQIRREVVGSILAGKKWVAVGDSFTDYTDKQFQGGTFDGQDMTYPRVIAERCNMTLVQFMMGGQTLAYPAVPGTFANSITCPTSARYYQNIPADADYITFYIGINDEHHMPGSSGGDGEDNTGEIPLGTIDDATTATYYGAWNVVLSWLIVNRPNAHIGIIVTNGLSIAGYRDAQIAIARKFGIPFIDMNGDDRTPAMLRTVNPNIDETVKAALIAKWAVDPTGESGERNTHPNWQAHQFEAAYIENFLKSI